MLGRQQTAVMTSGRPPAGCVVGTVDWPAAKCWYPPPLPHVLWRDQRGQACRCVQQSPVFCSSSPAPSLLHGALPSGAASVYLTY